MKSCVVTQNKTRRRRLEGTGPAAERKDTGSHINTFTALSIRLACCRFSFSFFPWRVPFPCLTRNCCGDKVQIQLQGEFACIFPRLGNVLCIVFGFIRGCVFWRSFIVFLVAFACGATGKVLSDAEGSGKSVRIFCFYSSPGVLRALIFVSISARIAFTGTLHKAKSPFLLTEEK